MDVPDVFRWVFAGLATLQLITLIPVLRRLRNPEPGVRTEARLSLLDALSSTVAFAGIAFGNGTLLLCGVACLGAVYAARGIRWYRTREQV
ncbi:hypothetical protein ACFUJ0_25400 [Streptomyces sp. NPDC057242]|uniref:hypothetical protein n=1 Tax=unclassified Streptomyces TaxID=2593676 RepID=UPI003628950B